MRKNKKKYIILFFILFLTLSVVTYFSIDYYRKSKKLIKVFVDKPSLTMRLVNYYGDTIYKFPVAVGTNYGNKQKVGDLKTPEGTFPIEGLEDSKDWKYDFENDGKGPIAGAYGPWFIRLKVQNASGIGIHGTHENESIGKRVSHGCVRMKNDDLMVLVNLISTGIEVSISPDTVKVK
jgi:lipoprotein-anchoring transpeptidase ErfK/SrfK